nr:hypothetical protein [uncultured Actinoplanes sp.]
MNGEPPPANAEPFEAIMTHWLRSHCAGIVQRFLAGSRPHEAEWHPNGFIVCKLAIPCPYPVVRFHIWPESGRLIHADHPVIHSHDRHMTSMVICGDYSDELYAITPEDGSGGELRQIMNVIPNPESIGRDSREILIPSGRHVHLTLTRRRHVPATAVHAMAAGAIHATVVTGLCATLVVKSSSVGGGLEYVLGGKDARRIPVSRPRLAAADLRRYWDQLRPGLESFLDRGGDAC